MATAAVRDAGLRWLKPIAMEVVRGSRAVVVECFGLKPCWEWLTGKAVVRAGRRSLSRILEAGHKREMGRYDELWSAGFPALSKGIMMACFHWAGRHAELTERLKIYQRKEMPEGPRCLRCRLVMSSGPVAVELLV